MTAEEWEEGAPVANRGPAEFRHEDPGPEDELPSRDDEAMSNETFGLLVERALNTRDHGATDELSDYFLRKIHRKVMQVEHNSRADVAQELLKTAFKAARRTLEKPVELPRNYVMRAVTNRFIDLIKKLNAPTPLSLSSIPEFPGLTLDDGQDLNRVALLELRKRSANEVTRKVFEVILVMYVFQVSETYAAEKLLCYGRKERATVLRTLRRWRKNWLEKRRGPLSGLFDDGTLEG